MTTIHERRQTLDRVLATPHALPAFDLAAYRGLPRSEQVARWQRWSDTERLRVAHAALVAKHGYSTEAGAAIALDALNAKFGGAA